MSASEQIEKGSLGKIVVGKLGEIWENVMEVAPDRNLSHNHIIRTRTRVE
jgi:hypothetical protein